MKSKLVQMIWMEMEKYGLQKKSSTFYRDQHGIRSEILIDSSKWSRKDDLEVTVRLIIYVKRIQSIVSWATTAILDKLPEGSTKYWHPQVWMPLALLMPEGQDKWWHIHDEETLTQASQEILAHIFRYIIPEMERCSTEEQLLELWRSGYYGGVSTFERKKNYIAMTSADEEEITAISRGVDAWNQYCVHHQRLDETKPLYKL